MSSCIAFEDHGFSGYRLSAPGAEAEICPERGALVTSLRLNGHETLYLDRATFLDRSQNVRGGIPILFPICGPLRAGAWQNAGKDYPMGQHGLARRAAWRVLEAPSEEARLDLGFEADKNSLEHYPFHFELRFRFELRQRGLRIEQRYTNLSQQTMPFQTGLHPYFSAPDKSHLNWDIPASQFRDNEGDRSLQPFSGAVPTDRLSDWEFPDISRARAAVAAVELRFSEHYPVLVAWNLPDKPFVCLEPWSGPRYGLQDRQQLLELEPGQSCMTWVEIAPRDGHQE